MDTDKHISNIVIKNNENTPDISTFNENKNILNSTLTHNENTSDHSTTLLSESGFLNVTPCLCENHAISIEKILASISDSDEGLKRLKIIRNKYLSNPLIGYLNINSLRGDKFLLLKDIISDCPIEVLCVDKTKLSYDYTDAQFLIDGYQYPPFRTYETCSFMR